MKIPLTDKFLWDIYNAVHKASDIFEAPEVFRLKSFGELFDTGKYQYWKDYRRKQSKKQFAQFIYYLKSKGYIRVKKLEQGRGLLLTPKGLQRALIAKYKIEPEKNLKKRKDKKWLMVIFDVPERQKRHREILRSFLRSLGFKKLQQSVWVSPYDVYKDLERVIQAYSLDDFVRIFVISEIEI